MAFILAITIVVSITLITGNFSLGAPRSPMDVQSSDDKRIASEISNAAGVDIETVLSIRNSGKSWNEVIDELERRGLKGGNDSRLRNDILTQLGATGGYAEELKRAGFTDDEIQQAYMLVDRVLFQLRHIAANSAGNPEPSVIIPDDPQTEDLSAYKDLANHFDSETCVYLTVRLYRKLGSMEAVIDEYLFALQTGLDLMLYLIEREEYLSQKQDKASEIYIGEIITVTAIDEKMLETLSRENEAIAGNSKDASPMSGGNGVNPANIITPQIPMPEIIDVSPKNPQDQVLDELKVIDPMKNME